MRVIISSTLFAFGMTVGLSDPVRACTCLNNPGVSVFPVPGMVDVPTNTIIVRPDPGYTLFDESSGQPIAFEERLFLQSSTVFRAIIPIADLPPNSTISVRSVLDSSASESGVQFTTGDGPDTEIPAPPVLAGTSSLSQPSVPSPVTICGTYSHLEPRIVDNNEPMLAFDFEASAGGDSSGQNIRALDLPTSTEDSSELLRPVDFLTMSDSPQVTNFCGGQLPASGGDFVQFRLSMVDAAGNFGEWSDWQTAFLPPNLPVPLTLSCSCVGNSQSPHLSAAVLFCVAFALLRPARRGVPSFGRRLVDALPSLANKGSN